MKTLPSATAAVTRARAGAALPRPFDVIFFLCSLPFVWLVSRDIALALRFEDALIVLRYARNLAEGLGFVYNPGERVLGVTTPLHTLISAVFVLLGGDHAPAVQNVAGVVFLVLEAWLAATIVRRTHGALLGFLVAVILVTNLNFNYLYFGMETHFYAFLILLCCYFFALRKETLTGLALGVAFLTRYDAALLALLIGLFLLAEKRRPPLKLVGAFSIVVAPWLLFSLYYFHSILPSSLGAKKDYYPVFGYLRFIFVYYQEYFARLAAVFVPGGTVGMLASWGFPLAAAVGTLSLARIAADRLVLVAYAALQVVIYALLGPDPGFYWHYYILNPVLTILVMVGLHDAASAVLGLGSRGGKRYAAAARRLVQGALLVAIVLALGNLRRQLDYKFQLDPHSRQFYAIGGWLDQNYDDETSLLQPSIGILGYATNLRIVDHAGLVTPGLHYFDSSDHTPMAEVLERFAPDLVLIPEGEDEHRALPAHGYRVVRTFNDPATYLLYERGAP